MSNAFNGLINMGHRITILYIGQSAKYIIHCTYIE
jgi:hypothetical protein